MRAYTLVFSLLFFASFGFSEPRLADTDLSGSSILLREEYSEAEKTPQFQEDVFVPQAALNGDSLDISESEQQYFWQRVAEKEEPEPQSFEIQFEAEADPVQDPYGEDCFEEEACEEICIEYDFDCDPYCDPEKRWYFELKPGYFYFSDSDMRHFFNDGGFAIRAETGCRFYEYAIVWVDGSYFEKKGRALGGSEELKIKLASITLGLKGIYNFNDQVAVYGGLGPRLFMMLLHNASPFVRGDDNEIGIGGGFNAGLWLYPIPKWENLFFDVFVDYSLKELKVDADEISSFDYDVDVSGLTGGIGIGIRF